MLNWRKTYRTSRVRSLPLKSPPVVILSYYMWMKRRVGVGLNVTGHGKTIKSGTECGDGDKHRKQTGYVSS